MTEITANPRLVQTRTARLLKYGLQVLILLPVIAGFFAYRLWTTQSAAPAQSVNETVTQTATTVISPKTLEERFGLRITLIAVTAGGGIIDFRYKVLDKKKAGFLLGDGMPTLIGEATGITVLPPAHVMKHNAQIENGANYFMFYPNTRNAVKPGDHVSVVIGSIRLDPIIVQ